MGRRTDELREQIEKRRNKSINGSYFINRDDIDALLTRTIIEETIKECVQDHAVPEHLETVVVNRIFTEGKIVFGVLIWRKWLHKLMSFIEHNALDSQLPLEIEWAEQIAENVGWDFANNAQWEFLPRTLTKEMSGYHCSFRDEEILPFIHEMRLGEGSFGEVSRMLVLPLSQTIFPDEKKEVFIVRKTLKDLPLKREKDSPLEQKKVSTMKPEKVSFLEREKECLQILHHLQHPNIVKLLASYSHCGKHHFLFPELSMDLGNFLQLEERFGEFKNDFMFYSALEGLSSALETVHSLNLNAREHDIELGRIGYHHDLRPANVLVDSRTFYLADFGLARLKPEDKGSRTLWKAGLGDYVAPECMDEKMVRKEVGRPLDIWSFGCMVFEIAAYIEGGPGGVKRFQKQRLASGFRSNMTNQYFFSGSNLRPGVVSWFEHFKVRSNSLKSKALRHLLDAASSMLKIDPNERPKVAEVHQKLSLLSLEALFDAVQQALSRHLETAQDQGGVPVTMIRNEIVRLAAWGSALQLTESNPSTDAIDTASNKYKYFCHILTSLIQKSDSDLKAEETVSPSVVTFSICKPFHEELKVFIDKLCNSLPAMQREKQRQMWLVDSLDTSRKGLHDIESSKLSSQYSDLGVMASTKQEIMTNDDNQDTEMPRPKAKSLKLNPDTFQTKCNFDEGLSIGRYDDKQVLVETISHTANWGDMSGHRREQHMQRTAEVFSKLFGKYILECRGFVIPSSGVSGQHDGAFVWAFPAPPQRQSVQPQNIAPISLFNVLKSRKKNELPLGERFHLAYKLVCCVRELNIVSLLHKNINSRNVVFFVEKESISALSDVFQDPYLVNFRYSQHSANAYQTMKPENGLILQHYQHPDYSLSEDFQETYDYYSIGILLLELGSWTTLDIYLNHNPALKSNPSAFRHELINKYAPRLDYIMGATYRDVTLACLQGDFGQGLEGERGPTVIGKFQDKVVTPLGKLSMAQI